MPFYDFHTHTHFSHCCKETYSYPDTALKIKELGLDGFGVSDHSISRVTHLDFLKEQKTQQQQLNLIGKGLVGLEISILNQKGALDVHPKYERMCDYKIISEHVHVARLFSDFYHMKEKTLKRALDLPTTEAKINADLDKITEMVVNGIHRNSHCILGHILNFPVNSGLILPKCYDMLDKILDACQSSAVALELHPGFMGGYESQDPANIKFKGVQISKKEFYTTLAHRIKSYSLSFSLGSDSHKMTNFIPKTRWIEFLQKINIPESQLITPAFFKK